MNLQQRLDTVRQTFPDITGTSNPLRILSWVEVVATASQTSFMDTLRDAKDILNRGHELPETINKVCNQVQCPEWAAVWTLDEVAECLEVGSIIYGKAYKLLEEVDKQDRTPLGGDGTDGTVETPDGRLGNDPDKLCHHWVKFTPWEQQIMVNAYVLDHGEDR